MPLFVALAPTWLSCFCVFSCSSISVLLFFSELMATPAIKDGLQLEHVLDYLTILELRLYYALISALALWSSFRTSASCDWLCVVIWLTAPHIACDMHSYRLASWVGLQMKNNLISRECRNLL